MATLWGRLTALFRTSKRSPGPSAAGPTGAPGASKTLYVGNLLAGVTERDLRRLFGQYGIVTKAQIPTHPALGGPMGFGFVEMGDGADAAITALDGTSFRGQTLVVNQAQRSQPQPSPLSEILDRFGANADRPDGPERRQALNDLRELAETGDAEAAQELAEILARPGADYDPEAAYKWYYIGLSQQGYTVQFEDHNGIPPHYCGPVGDFRNECGVSDLVAALGYEKVRVLDAEAERWLADRNLKDS